MTKCFLKGFGECNGAISREHYISASLLRYIQAKGGFKIGGLAWQPRDVLQSIGISSLQSKILCEGHNSSLSLHDSIAAKLFLTLDAVDKSRSTLPALSQFDGPTVERWFLKVLCGISASGGFSSEPLPDKWKALLSGALWPEHWGLYVYPPQGQQIFSTDLLIETMINPVTKNILAALFRVAGVTFYILFGKPDNLGAFGHHRPRGLIFRHGDEEHRIEFLWPFHTEQAIIYTNVGTTKDEPPHLKGWKNA